MGFMAGFGSAFADSFNQDQQVKAQHKEDLFRLQYQDYISRRDKQDQIDTENKKNVRLAKQLAAQSGQPPEAWQSGYELLSSGASPEYVAKMFSENQAIIEKNSNTTKPGEGATASDAQPADPRDTLTAGAQSSVDAQMTASGMKTPEQAGQGGGIFAGVTQALGGGNSQSRAQRDSQRAQEQVAGAAGVPVEQVQKVLGPGGHVPGEPIDGQPDAAIKWQPKGQTFEALRDKANNIGDAQALAVWTEDPANHATPEQQQFANTLLERYKSLKASEISQNAFALDPSKVPLRGMIRKKDGTGYEDKFVSADYSNGDPMHPIWRDEQGQEVDPKIVAPVGLSQEKDMQAVADEASEDSKPVAEARVAQKNLIRTGNDYLKLLKDNKGKYDSKAMDISGDLTQFVSRWKRAGVNIVDLVMPKGNIEDANAAISALDKEEQRLRKTLTSGKLVDAIDQNAAKASLIDIQGTKLAYMMAAQANGGPKGVSNQDFQKWKDAVSGNGNPATAAKALQMSVDQGNKSLGDMESGVRKGRGKASYYKGKYPNAPTGYDYGQSFDEEVNSDPELSEALKNISAGASLEDNPGQQLDTSSGTMPPEIKAKYPDITQSDWDHMTEADRKLFTGE